MGAIRAFAPHRQWTALEVAILRDHYRTAPWPLLLRFLPGRARRHIACKANEIGLRRPLPAKMSDAERLRRKRRAMARRRARDLDGARQLQRTWTAKNRDRLRRKQRAYQRARFFWFKLRRLKKAERPSPQEIARLWKRQRGRCALTGRRLDRTAELDHIIPKNLGGSDRLDNLQWVCREANRAKGKLSQDAFLALCADAVSYAGKAPR